MFCNSDFKRLILFFLSIERKCLTKFIMYLLKYIVNFILINFLYTSYSEVGVVEKSSNTKAWTGSQTLLLISSCCAYSLSRVQLFATLRTVAGQAPLSMGILQARTLEWVAMPSSRGSFQPQIEPRSPALQADSLLSEPPGKLCVSIKLHLK